MIHYMFPDKFPFGQGSVSELCQFRMLLPYVIESDYGLCLYPSYTVLIDFAPVIFIGK